MEGLVCCLGRNLANGGLPVSHGFWVHNILRGNRSDSPPRKYSLEKETQQKKHLGYTVHRPKVSQSSKGKSFRQAASCQRLQLVCMLPICTWTSRQECPWHTLVQTGNGKGFSMALPIDVWGCVLLRCKPCGSEDQGLWLRLFFWKGRKAKYS